MAAVTFDTLKFVKTLQAAGVSVPQSEAIATAVRESTENAELATKSDLRELKSEIQIELQKELAPIKADMLLLKWMVGVIVAGVLALVIKAFLHV